jgi:hypothetical protein
MKVGDLVRTPKCNAIGGILGPGYYDWEDKLAIVVGFDTICERTDETGRPFIEVRIQDTGKLCIFSPSVLAKVK